MSNRILHYIHIESQTYEDLEYLKRELNSPKTWIIRKLVRLETQRLKNAENRNMEVVTR